MKKRLTALVISVIMVCGSMAACGKKEDVRMRDYEATVNGEPFKVSYSLKKTDGSYFTDEEAEEVDGAVSKAITGALFVFSESNSAGVGEINKAVDAVLDCSSELLELISYTYSLSSLTGGKYQPAFGAVTELYAKGEEVTDEALAEAIKHTGMDLISIEDNTVRKSDRAAKLDYESISAGYALADVLAVLSVKKVSYAVLTYKNTVATFGSPTEDEKVDIAVYMSGNNEQHSGILSVDNAVVTTCNKESLVLDSATGKKIVSDHDTVAVICSDGIISNVLANVLYGMTTAEIEKLYNSKVFDFEAIVIDAEGEVFKTSDLVDYAENVLAS